MAKDWIGIDRTSGSGDSEVRVSAPEHTGREPRTGRIAGTTAGGAASGAEASQKGAAETTVITGYTDNGDGTVTVTGRSNSATLSVSGIDGASCALSVGGEVQSPWNGTDETSVPGDPGAGALFEFEITITLPDTNGGTYTLDVNGEEITMEVEGDTITYGTPVVTLSYGTISAAGGTVSPTLTYSQTYTVTGADGTVKETGTITSGAEVAYGGSVVDAQTGEVTAASLGTTLTSSTTTVDTVTASVTLNGVTGTATATVVQAANTRTSSTSYGTPTVTLTYDTTTISAAGGTATPTVSWNQLNTTKYTYASGSTSSSQSRVTSGARNLSAAPTGLSIPLTERSRRRASALR